jgi:hypothetical protein
MLVLNSLLPCLLDSAPDDPVPLQEPDHDHQQAAAVING